MLLFTSDAPEYCTELGKSCKLNGLSGSELGSVTGEGAKNIH